MDQEEGIYIKESGSKWRKISDGVNPKEWRNIQGRIWRWIRRKKDIQGGWIRKDEYIQGSGSERRKISRGGIRRNEVIKVVGVITWDIGIRTSSMILIILLHEQTAAKSFSYKVFVSQIHSIQHCMTLSRWFCRENVSFARVAFVRHFFYRIRLIFVVLPTTKN